MVGTLELPYFLSGKLGTNKSLASWRRVTQFLLRDQHLGC